MTEAGIGQLLGQHHGPVAPEAAEHHEADAALPAMGEGDVVGHDRPQHPVAEPVPHRLAQGRLLALRGIIAPVGADLPRHPPQRLREERHLPHVGQLRRAQIQKARRSLRLAVDEQGLRGPQPRLGRRDEGASPHGRSQKPLLRGHLIGPRDGAGRDRQSPGQIPHGRKLHARQQHPFADRLPQRPCQGEIFGAGELCEVRMPYCISHNVPLERIARALYALPT